jgi:hypothetical protein
VAGGVDEGPEGPATAFPALVLLMLVLFRDGSGGEDRKRGELSQRDE